MEPLLRISIWKQFIQAKYGEIYLSLYIDQQKQINKEYKILTLVFSGLGVLGWKIFDQNQYLLLLSTGITSIIQLIALLSNQIFLSEETLSRIGKLRHEYLLHFNKLELLWQKIEAKKITDDDARNSYSQLKNEYVSIITEDSQFAVKELKKVKKKAGEKTRTYFKNFYS